MAWPAFSTPVGCWVGCWSSGWPRFLFPTLTLSPTLQAPHLSRSRTSRLSSKRLKKKEKRKASVFLAPVGTLFRFPSMEQLEIGCIQANGAFWKTNKQKSRVVYNTIERSAVIILHWTRTKQKKCLTKKGKKRWLEEQNLKRNESDNNTEARRTLQRQHWIKNRANRESLFASVTRPPPPLSFLF